MKYYIKTRLSSRARVVIEHIIGTHNKYKNSYFWRPGSSANERRNREREFNNENDDVILITKEGDVKVTFLYTESCRNVYYALSIEVEGVKKDIRFLKKLLKRKAFEI